MTQLLASIADEFRGGDLGDLRLSARLVQMAECLSARPDQPLPDVFLNEAGLEGAYRFLNNDRVTPSAVLAPHIEATSARAKSAGRLLVLHDTTTLHFDGRGFGPLRGTGLGEGFYAHVALAVDATNQRAPLGVLGVRTFEREERPEGQRKTKEERRADNEMHHWRALVEDVLDSIGDVPAVHVMDRQADSFVLLSSMIGRTDFVVRATHDRVVNTDGERARALLAAQPVILQRTVGINARKGSGWTRDRHHPVREERTATLHIMSAPIELQRPTASNATPRGTTPPLIAMNAVRVVEADPPEGEQPIEWLLWTTLPTDTAAQVADVVDIYRTRWMIEELFKAVKTGCAYEQRRLESQHGLLNLFALTIPIACRLLLLRHLARQTPDAPARLVFTRSQLAVLAATPRAALPDEPTIHDGLWAVARLGGHLRRNGEPGWQVLTRGYHELLVLEEGWLAARGGRAEM